MLVGIADLGLMAQRLPRVDIFADLGERHRDADVGQLLERAPRAAVGPDILAVTQRKVGPEFRARHGVERILDGLMIACAVVAILTTLGIVVSLLFEAFRFFDRITLSEFLFGLNWEPQIDRKSVV